METTIKVGVDDAEGPPVPIPNTEVKLSGAEDTWLATAREKREMPTLIFLHSSVGSDDVLLKYRNYLVDFEGKLNMLFKSTTGDLSNQKDCSLGNLNKNLW